MGRYFGVRLEELTLRENSKVPWLVVSCATSICSQGMQFCYFSETCYCMPSLLCVLLCSYGFKNFKVINNPTVVLSHST